MALNILKERHVDTILPSGSEWIGAFEPGIELEGRLTISTGMVRLNCRVKGEIVSEGTVAIGERGDVEATIQAKVVSIAGKVKGNVQASERLEIKEHGVVLGDIHTPVLIVEPGGYLDGQCKMPSPESLKTAQVSEQHSPAPTDPRDLQL
ncbi:MAG TPA: polymer-forming cytoskeletal protein [Terriglobia bacterium]|nr:polymer-forming cytoskeletal protein [Terriglobia bacterium]